MRMSVICCAWQHKSAAGAVADVRTGHRAEVATPSAWAKRCGQPKMLYEPDW